MVRWRGSLPSPLHSTVPLDGSQTVAGLQELQRTARSASIKRLPSAPQTKGRTVRNRRARAVAASNSADLAPPALLAETPSRGRGVTASAMLMCCKVPSASAASEEQVLRTTSRATRCSSRRSLDSLSLEDLTAPPRPWPMFLRGGTGGMWSAAYDVPADLDALQERLEANVLYYLVRRHLLPSGPGLRADALAPRQHVRVSCAACPHQTEQRQQRLLVDHQDAGHPLATR